MSGLKKESLQLNKKLRIGLDLDNTLILSKTIDIASKKLGYKFKEESSTDYQLNCFPEDLRQKVFEMFENPEFMCDLVKPIKGTQELIKKWAKKHDLILITARSLSIGRRTIELVNKLYPQIKDITIVGGNASKEEQFKLKFLDYWIDDNPRDVLIAKKLGINTIMVSNKFTKYNHNIRDNVEWVKVITEVKL